MKTITVSAIQPVDSAQLHTRLALSCPFQPSDSTQQKSLVDWKMEEDDAPIFRYLYRQLQPKRHLEFGTWRGTGTCYCLENAPGATVWTINLVDGESTPEGRWAYDDYLGENDRYAGLTTRKARNGKTVVRTDARLAIGTEYLDKNLGHRVCQIYADSTQWDDSNFPDGFFDTVLIDGGHTPEVVASDTRKALRLVKSGGVILWHDYCPVPEVQALCPSTVGVNAAIENLKPLLEDALSDLFWINPSWILAGIRNQIEVHA